MEMLRREKSNNRTMLFIIFYGINIVSFIKSDINLFSIWDILIACCFFLVQIYQSLKSRVTAISYQISWLVTFVSIILISFHTAIRHALLISYPSWIVFIIIGVLPVVGLIFQFQVYKIKLIDSTLELIQMGKFDERENIWNIDQRLETESMRIKEGGQRILNWMKYLSYLAPGLGMLTSRNLDNHGQSMLSVYLSLLLYVLVVVGLALPMAELWLINHIQKERKITIYI